MLEQLAREAGLLPPGSTQAAASRGPSVPPPQEAPPESPTHGEINPTMELRFGKIVLGEMLGKGGFGDVYAASVEHVDFPFAVKILNPSPFQSELAEAHPRFLREAGALFQLRHRHIIAIYGVGEHEGKPYILMEHFDGKNLVQARDDHGGDFPPAPLVPFILRIAEALAYAHSENVVHRDIKPSNLMTSKGDARVLDFGIAVRTDSEINRLTRTGGTVHGGGFCAPELDSHPRDLDPKCDVYSLGACWFWLITGSTPKGMDWGAFLGSDVPSDYKAVLLRCLAPAADRYTMSDLVKELKLLQAGDRPDAGLDVMTDDDILILSVIRSVEPGMSPTFKGVHSPLQKIIPRIAINIGLDRLIRVGPQLTKVFAAPTHLFPQLTDAYVASPDVCPRLTGFDELAQRIKPTARRRAGRPEAAR